MNVIYKGDKFLLRMSCLRPHIKASSTKLNFIQHDHKHNLQLKINQRIVFEMASSHF